MRSKTKIWLTSGVLLLGLWRLDFCNKYEKKISLKHCVSNKCEGAQDSSHLFDKFSLVSLFKSLISSAFFVTRKGWRKFFVEWVKILQKK